MDLKRIGKPTFTVAVILSVICIPIASAGLYYLLGSSTLDLTVNFSIYLEPNTFGPQQMQGGDFFYQNITLSNWANRTYQGRLETENETALAADGVLVNYFYPGTLQQLPKVGNEWRINVTGGTQPVITKNISVNFGTPPGNYTITTNTSCLPGTCQP